MEDNAYGALARLLHRMALANPAIAETAFDIERAIHGANGGAVADGAHVFVASLARAGTTILMRQMYATGAFRSLTYRDMPFVLAPNLWRAVGRLAQRDKAAEERAHGDGIRVNYDSPEALEEVFWRITCGDAYIRPDRLLPMTAGAERVDDFRDYVALILKADPGKRYLSKNNNNILRLATIARAFPKAALVIPFRAPLAHAGSLMRQHRHFLDRHRRDPFARQYMTWLAHHEFGADHRPFVFAGEPPGGAPDSLAYWLHLWIDVYGRLIASAPKSAIFVSYERLCGDPAVWQRLCRALALATASPAEPFRASRGSHGNAPRDLVERANDLHAALAARAV